jgi:hypothetical protein
MGVTGRGNAGEAAVLNALVQRGFDVFLPFGEGHPFDLIVLAGDRFARIQCKTAWPNRGCILFNSHSTDHGHGIRSYVGLADLFGVYFPPHDSVFSFPWTRYQLMRVGCGWNPHETIRSDACGSRRISRSIGGPSMH